jgi:hypothetical protein
MRMGGLYENIVGQGEVDTPGERLGELIRGAGAATARGIADVPALPANLVQLGAMGVEKALGMEEPSMVSRAVGSLPDTRDMLAAVPVIGPESQYVAPGTAGEFVATAGEFAGGAGAIGGAGQMLRYGVAPGVASEAAGQATEGTAAEPYARTGAALATAIFAGRGGTPFAGDDEAARMANTLQDSGVRNITAGQARGSQGLMRAEGRLQPTSQQLDDFTAAAMRQIGSTDTLATPQALRAAQDAIVRQMDDAVAGASIAPTATEAQRALQIGVDYVDSVPAGSLTPRVRGIAQEINNIAKQGGTVPLERLREWRSGIGRLTISPDAATREAAHGLRTLIDDMTDQALTAAGRTDDIAKLAQGREAYRNFIGIRDAASRAGAEGGRLSPQALNQSVIRSQGREAYATGRTTPMGEFTRAGASVLRPAPTVNAGGARSVTEALPLASAAMLGGGALSAGANPLAAGAMAAAGALAPVAGQSVMRSQPVQSLLRGSLAENVLRTYPVTPGVMQER